jgi:transcriptional regulator with XRE-family HTH domain
MSNLGMRIKLIRTRKGIKQNHVDRALDKYPGWLAAVENRGIMFPASDLPGLAKVLGVEVAEFFMPESPTGT